VPYLLGYHPGEEIVAVYLGADQRILAVAAEPIRFSAETLSEHLMLRAPAGPCAQVALIGYGPASMRPTLTTMGRIIDLFLPLYTLLWVTGSRCVCLLDRCSCEASRGMDVDPATSSGSPAGCIRYGSCRRSAGRTLGRCWCCRVS
jgi:hypothetical protein